MSTAETTNSQQLRSISDPERGYQQRKQLKNGWTTIGGDCPVLRKYLAKKKGAAWEICKFFVSFARGFAQTVFANNPIAGIILMISLASMAPGTFIVCSVAGLLGHSISILLKEPTVHVDNGLTVFNPLIFGAVSYYLVPVVYGGFDGFSTLIMVFGIIFMAYLWRACASGCIPCLTMPFNLTELMLLFTLKNARNQLVNLAPEALSQTFLNMNNETASAATAIVGAVEANERFVDNATVVLDNLDWGMVVRASVVSASQLYAVNSVPMGAIVYLSLLIYSPITCCFSYMGALVASLVGLQLGATYESVYVGLWGLNGYLTGATLGGSFLVLNGQVAVATCVAIIFTAFLQHVMLIIFIPTGLPVGTIPYVLTIWLFIGLGKSSEGIFFYPAKISFPEAHRKELLSCNGTEKLKKNQEECDPEVVILNGKESII